MRNLFGPVVMVVLAATTAHCNDGCAGWRLSEPSVGDLYAAEQVACVEKSHTLEEEAKCRADVDRKYGICKRDDGLGPCN